MKNYQKMIGIGMLCMVFFLGYPTKAATGDVLGTGSISTGTTVAYTGSLLNYLNAQESNLSS